jgi:hypothetical protein
VVAYWRCLGLLVVTITDRNFQLDVVPPRATLDDHVMVCAARFQADLQLPLGLNHKIACHPQSPAESCTACTLRGIRTRPATASTIRPHAEAFELFKSFAFPDEQPVARNTKTRAVKAKAKRKAA